MRLADAIAQEVEARDEANVPIPKYMLVVSIHGNTLEELRRAVDQFALDMETEWWDREFIDATDGTTSVRLERTNANQTPERYYEQLHAWRDSR